MPKSSPVALRLEPGAEVPIIQRSVQLAALQLLGQQRRRAVDRLDRTRQVEPAISPGIGLEHQPALVERAARDAQLLAIEVQQGVDRAVGLHHHRADIARVGDEGQRHTVAALTRDEQPVLDDRIDRPAHQRHVRRVVAPERHHLEGEPFLGVEAVGLDDVELPVDRAELEHAHLHGAEIGRAGRCGGEHCQGQSGQKPARAAPHCCLPRAPSPALPETWARPC